MSDLLDTLAFLDLARRRDCEANDAALRELDMKHRCEKPARLFAQMQERQPSPCERDFHITVMQVGRLDITYVERSADSFEAFCKAREKYGDAVVIDVNPASWMDLSMMGAA